MRRMIPTEKIKILDEMNFDETANEIEMGGNVEIDGSLQVNGDIETDKIVSTNENASLEFVTDEYDNTTLDSNVWRIKLDCPDGLTLGKDGDVTWIGGYDSADYPGLWINSSDETYVIGNSITLQPESGSVEIKNDANNDLVLDIRPASGQHSYIGTATNPINRIYMEDDGHILCAPGSRFYITDYQDEGGLGINPNGSVTVYTNLIFENLPTSDPQVVGAVWNDNGTLKISSGS